MKSLLVFLSLMLSAGLAMAESRVAVIVNSANTQNLSIKDVKGVYSDVVTTWRSGRTINAYDLQLDAPERELFSRAVLGMSASAAQMATHNKEITNTLRNPIKAKREQLVLSVVAKDPDAIGYVSAASVEGKTGIRVLFTLP
ncbi:MAG TPA: hypothetical protein VGA00_08715 [Acidiferrobacterales bacterium]|jgi:ABC-type phosphate transport system substrate-binding protein